MTEHSRPRVAVVVQRFLPATGGGAEEHCRSLVLALREAWEIDVLTTCARDHHTWANELPAGEVREDGFRTIRFPVARTKRRVLSAILPRTLLRAPHPEWLEEVWVRALGPDSPALLEHLGRESASYRFTIFYTYLYATTVLGLPRAGPRTLLVPTAHDEPGLRLRGQRRAVASAGALAFLTPEEGEVVERVCGPLEPGRQLLLGAELPEEAWIPGDPGAFRRKYGISGPFLLYLGRIERSKGLVDLLSIHARHEAKLPPLVLAGRRGPLALPRSAHALGFISEEDKRGALAACEALVQPSARESLSLVLLEAWAQRRPALVNRTSAPLAGQCRRSGGGLGYEGAEELLAAVEALRDPARRAELGEGGYRYARAEYGAGTFRARLVPFVEKLGWLDPGAPTAPAREAATVPQTLPAR